MSDELHKNKMASWMIKKFQQEPEEFPGHGQTPYDQIFLQIEHDLNRGAHKDTAAFAAMRDGQGFLTDHGPEHIAMVMRRARILADTSANLAEFDTLLTPYEVFILLMSCHCHDVGNVYGRNGHEKRILDVLSRTTHFSSLKPSEWRQITQIASVHGGTIDGDKDTIGKVIAAGPLDIMGKSIRPQLLAAILRLADELADDHTRANEFGMKMGIIPKESEIYHRYAKCLETVKINNADKTIELGFVLYPDDLSKQLGKKKGKKGKIDRAYLIDEIHQRTSKTFCELLYCTKFMREWPNHYERVKVRLEAYVDPTHSLSPFCTHSYVLHDRGYPMQRGMDIRDLCDNFDDLNGVKLKEKYDNTLNYV